MTEARPPESTYGTTSGATSTGIGTDVHRDEGITVDRGVQGYRETDRWGDRGFSDRPVGNRIRGGPVWGGFAVAFALWLFFELILFAIDATGVDFGISDADTTSWAWSGAAAVLAFFIGGIVAGSASPFRGVGTGALDGIVVWAIGMIAVLLLSSLAGGLTFGAFGDVLGFSQAVDQTGPGGAQVAPETLNDFQDAAGWAALFVGLSLAAAAIGGMIGAKTWPPTADRHEDRTEVRVR